MHLLTLKVLLECGEIQLDQNQVMDTCSVWVRCHKAATEETSIHLVVFIRK